MAKKETMLPPPPEGDVGLRDWLAGCALSNPYFTKGAKNSVQAIEMAYEAADMMVNALKLAPAPVVNVMSSGEMRKWECELADKRERCQKLRCETVQATPRSRKDQNLEPRTGSTLPRISLHVTSTPTSMTTMFPSRVPDPNRKPTIREGGRYCCTDVKPEVIK